MKYKIRLIFSHPKDTDSDTFAFSTLEITYEPFKEEYDALIRPEEWPDEDAHGGIRHRVTLYGESIEKVEWIEFNRATEKFLKKSENCRCFVKGENVSVEFDDASWYITQPIPVKEKHEI